MDIRVTPSPADFPVISTPGFYTGWSLTVDMAPGEVRSVNIFRGSKPEEVAAKLRALADKIEEMY